MVNANTNHHSIIEVISVGLNPRTVLRQRPLYKAFATYRGMDSAETALQDLIKMDRGQVKSVLDGFHTHERKRGLSETSVALEVTTIRTAVRKARAAGLTNLDVGGKPAKPAPGSLMDVLQVGLNPRSVIQMRSHYKAFATYRGMDSAETALQDLIKMDRGQVKSVLDGFHTHERKRGKSERIAKDRVIIIRTAVRKARAAGLTNLDVDRPSNEPAPGSLMDVLQAGLTPGSVVRQRSLFKTFATYRGMDSAETALQDLIKMDRGQVKSVLDGFHTHERKRGLSETSVALEVTTIRTAVRKARAAGLTNLDVGRSKTPKQPPRKAVARSHRPRSRNAERDDFCIGLREQGVSSGEILRRVKQRSDWTQLASRQALVVAIKRRCKALGREVPRATDAG